MEFEAPSAATVKAIADELGLKVSAEEAAEYATIMGGMLDAYRTVAAQPARPAQGQGRQFRHLKAEENPFNAWYVKTSIREREEGPLAGKRVAVKDSIMVAGVPMMNGSNVLEGYVPEADATVIRRVLDAGGEIAGKTHCEYLCLSGGSHTSWTGPVTNPWRAGYSAGGSSSGSAVAVARGEVDVALGTDQAGSIRMPASFSGVIGMKPTFGLVPATGVAPIESSFDHVGPLSRTVEDNALLLQVIAGDDGVDPRQRQITPPADYLGQLKDGVQGLRIGVLREGFGAPGAEPDVDQSVRDALATLARLGASVEEVSIPMHSLGREIWIPIAMEGLAHTALVGDGFGVSRLDDYPVDMMRWFHRNRSKLADAPRNVKLFLMMGSYITRTHGYSVYGHAINVARELRRQYDEALQRFDVLAMPTTPMKAQPMPAADAPLAEYVQRVTEMSPNTASFDITQHPALSLPCGFSDGLPVSLMLVGDHFAEATLYRTAYAYEQTGEGERGRPQP